MGRQSSRPPGAVAGADPWTRAIIQGELLEVIGRRWVTVRFLLLFLRTLQNVYSGNLNQNINSENTNINNTNGTSMFQTSMFQIC